MYHLFLIKTYELLSVFSHGMTDYFLEILNTYRTAVSPTLDLLCHEDFNVGRSEAESNTEIFMAQ